VKVVEERALISDYDSLCNDFNDLEAPHATLDKEKENVEKTEHEKAQQFHNHHSWSPS
jgi:hypothetical protein